MGREGSRRQWPGGGEALRAWRGQAGKQGTLAGGPAVAAIPWGGRCARIHCHPAIQCRRRIPKHHRAPPNHGRPRHHSPPCHSAPRRGVGYACITAARRQRLNGCRRGAAACPETSGRRRARRPDSPFAWPRLPVCSSARLLVALARRAPPASFVACPSTGRLAPTGTRCSRAREWCDTWRRATGAGGRPAGCSLARSPAPCAFASRLII